MKPEVGEPAAEENVEVAVDENQLEEAPKKKAGLCGCMGVSCHYLVNVCALLQNRIPNLLLGSRTIASEMQCQLMRLVPIVQTAQPKKTRAQCMPRFPLDGAPCRNGTARCTGCSP